MPSRPQTYPIQVTARSPTTAFLVFMLGNLAPGNPASFWTSSTSKVHDAFVATEVFLSSPRGEFETLQPGRRANARTLQKLACRGAGLTQKQAPEGFASPCYRCRLIAVQALRSGEPKEERPKPRFPTRGGAKPIVFG